MQDRVPALRKRVGKKRPPSLWSYVFIVLFFSGMLFVLFLRSPLSKLEKIEITGNRLLSETEILARIDVSPGDWYFTVDASRVEKLLETMPEIQEAKVVKEFPNRMYIQVIEKPRVALLKKGDQMIPVLSDGTILTRRPVNVAADEPVFEGWTENDALLRQAAAQFARLSLEIRREIRTVSPAAGRPDQVEIRTARHHRVIVRARDLARKMSYYPAFYQHEPGTVYLLESIWFSREGADGKEELESGEDASRRSE
jgi:cell division protein FtsQ